MRPDQRINTSTSATQEQTSCRRQIEENDAPYEPHTDEAADFRKGA